MRNVLLVWDIDGTLIQAGGLGKNAMDKAFLDMYGIKEAFRTVNMAGAIDGTIIKDVFSVHGIEDKDPSLFCERYCEYLAENISSLNNDITAPGISSLLSAISEMKHVFNALGTGNMEKAARIKLSCNNLNRYFPVGGFGNIEMERWKVIRQAVQNSKQHFGVDFKNEDIYIIGDTPKDIECGKKLKVKSIAVATGWHSYEELCAHQPDYLFRDLTDAGGFLEILE
ncbi:phosphoglycolate phosphatase-like HAD superfamily hydrolase [Anaerobacterium chartisolvens]|uniref:Phosphoglycolate phosphatase-like HAD superfamily hydrolase n=1 Tax=Anaerobacterium chartisolvens TaxID=1297424 RepID=A0A369BCH6_9FIRM|nr:HAD hydrolase-like protein [Anaerobacterium chartisolvens]RCX18276.1 phosphoglycolate phosphatase-like HAD superfamily hydrolase [Anaerobacterium chartisolvens]